MDNQQHSSLTSQAISNSTLSKRQAAQKTVVQLLDDKDAMGDWVANIERIRQMESDRPTKHTS